MKRYSALIVIFLVLIVACVIFASCYEPSGEANLIDVTNATINGNEVTMFVDFDTDSVSMLSSVHTSDNSTWVLSYDISGENVIKDKVAAGVDGKLGDGDNVFFIIVTSENKQTVNTYKLTIYKSFEVTVSYYDGQTLLTTDTAYTGKPYTVDYEPTLVGNTFNYWYFDGDSQTGITSFIPWDSTSLYLSKTAKTFTVTLDVNGGDSLTEAKCDVQYGATFVLPVPTYGDNVFVGWYDGEEQVTDKEGHSVSVWTYDSDKTLTAKWSIVYTVTVNATSGGTITGDSGQYESGKQLTLTAQTQDGYTWLGWYKNGESFSMEFELTIAIEESATYTATWIVCPIVVNFQVSSITNNDYQYVTAVDIPSKTVVGEQITLVAPETSQLGYEFIGWYDSSFSATGKLLSDRPEYTLEMPSVTTKLYIRYEKKEEMKYFSFKSTDTECIITSVSSDIANTDVVIPDYVTKLETSNSQRGVFQNLNILSVVVGTGITEIPEKTFQSNSKLTRVELMGDVEYIGKNAFYQCSALQSVSFGNALTVIDVAAFSQCSLLSELGNTDNLETLAREAFYKCYALKSINLPSIKSIGQSAFSQCTALTSAKLGSFSDGGELESSSLVELGISAFEQSGLTSIVIPGSVQTVSQTAFSKCSNLSDISIQEGVVTLDMYCFQSCPITAIELPNSVTTLNYTFYKCDKLTSIKFGEGLNFISISTFYGCNALTEVEFAVTDGWLGRNQNSTSGGIKIDPSNLTDKTTAAQTVLNTCRSQNMIREDN